MLCSLGCQDTETSDPMPYLSFPLAYPGLGSKMSERSIYPSNSSKGVEFRTLCEQMAHLLLASCTLSPEQRAMLQTWGDTMGWQHSHPASLDTLVCSVPGNAGPGLREERSHSKFWAGSYYLTDQTSVGPDSTGGCTGSRELRTGC